MAELGRMLSVVEGERVVVETFEIPEPGPGEVLVRVNRSQVSAGSEKGRFRGTSRPDPRAPLGYNPLQPGYTTVGRVQAVGPGVEEFKIDDRVFALAGHQSHALVAAGNGPEAPWRTTTTRSARSSRASYGTFPRRRCPPPPPS